MTEGEEVFSTRLAQERKEAEGVQFYDREMA